MPEVEPLLELVFVVSDGNMSVRSGKIKNNGFTSFAIDNMYYVSFRIQE